MAKGKKTFIFYSDWINMIEQMPNEDAGQLLKHILLYVNDKNPLTENVLVNMAFGHMKPMLKADLDKWDAIREKRKKAGAKGGKQTQANAKQMLEDAKQVQAVNDNVNVSTNVDESKINNIFLEYREKYKIYANQLYKDSIFIESISREFLKNTKPEICKATIKKYLSLFLNNLDQTKKIHNNKKDFQNHFPNWMRKQPLIEKVQPKKEKIRYF